MYRIDKSSNNVVKLEQRLFKDLRIREREHLQEWIAKNPEMLGEDLLIIQKEYDGFNDTKERLDLLALDKEGGIVVIENKLDDTGRDVVWQAIKYASYCSTLSTTQIVRIYQEYLDKTGQKGSAKENILEFLNRDESELLLNDSDQRIIFVANDYRKEVTSTVLWLLQHDIKLQCFRATPYSMGDELFLQVEQIIPLPETEEYIIDAKEKAKEDKGVSKVVADGQASLVRFWAALKAHLEENKCHFLDNVSAKPYYDTGFHKGVAKFAYYLGRTSFRIELYFGDDADKKYFNAMKRFQSQIESQYNGTIIWEQLEGKKASRIKVEITTLEINPEGHSFVDELYWEDLIRWYSEEMIKFYNVVYPYWEKVQKELNK